MGRFIGIDLQKDMFVASFYETEEGKNRVVRVSSIGDVV